MEIMKNASFALSSSFVVVVIFLRFFISSYQKIFMRHNRRMREWEKKLLSQNVINLPFSLSLSPFTCIVCLSFDSWIAVNEEESHYVIFMIFTSPPIHTPPQFSFACLRLLFRRKGQQQRSFYCYGVVRYSFILKCYVKFHSDFSLD